MYICHTKDPSVFGPQGGAHMLMRGPEWRCCWSRAPCHIICKLPSLRRVSIKNPSTFPIVSAYLLVGAIATYERETSCHVQNQHNCLSSTSSANPRLYLKANAEKIPRLVALSSETISRESSIDQNLPGTCRFAIQKTLQFLVPKGVLICWWEVRN